MNRRDVHKALKEWIFAPAAMPLPLKSINPSLADDAGFTALHILAEQEEASDMESFHFEQKAKILMLSGAPIHSGDYFMSYTPLHWCSWHPAPGTCAALLAAGAHLHAVNRNGDDAYALCNKQLASSRSGGMHRRGEKLRVVLSILASQHDKIVLDSFLPPPIGHQSESAYSSSTRL